MIIYSSRINLPYCIYSCAHIKSSAPSTTSNSTNRLIKFWHTDYRNPCSNDLNKKAVYMTSPTSTTAFAVAAASTDGGDSSGSGHGLDLDLIITIAVCSVAGAILFILSTILVILLVIINKTKGRKRMQEYSATRANHKNQGIQKHKKARETVKMRELTTDSDMILTAPQLPAHAAVVQQLQLTFTQQLQNPPTSANFRETSTNSTSGGAINSTSTNTTIVVDIEDSGIMDEAVFLERETESGMVASSSHLLHQSSQKCVPTCGHGSHECLETSPAMNLVPYQMNTGSTTGNGYPNNHRINRREPEADSPHGYVNITTAGKQALAHTSECSKTTQCSLSQPLLSKCNLGPTNCNHVENPSCECHSCCTSDDHGHGYVNILTRSSLSQPLLNDRHGDCSPTYINHTQLRSPSEIYHAADHGYANFPESSLPPFEYQMSAPVCAIQTDELGPTSNCGRDPANDQDINVSKHSLSHQESAPAAYTDHAHGPALICQHGQTKVPSQFHSLPPRTQQIITCNSCYQSSSESSHGHVNDSSYEDASSQSPMSQQTSRTKTPESASYLVWSSKPCSTSADDHGYINTTKLRSISQPNPVTANMLNSLLLPPRTILRPNFRKPTASKDKSSVHIQVPPRSRSKSTQHVHTSPPTFSEKVFPLSSTVLPAKDEQLAKFTEIESKSSSGCSSGSSDKLDKIVRKKRQHAHANNSKQNLSNFPSSSRDRGCSCDSVDDASYVIDKLESCQMSELVESLDVWPPVIPRRTELMFIVARDQQESQKDFSGQYNDHTDNTETGIKMTANKSYIKH